jgi:hypothetical protein
MNEQNNLKRGFQCLFGLTRRVGAIERLIQTSDAKYDLYGENLFKKRGFNAFSGLHEGLVLLKDLSKPSTPNRT